MVPLDSCVGAEASAAVFVDSVSFFSLCRLDSLFFSAVRRKTLMVVRNDLFGLQSWAERGECSQTGQDCGKLDWPFPVSAGNRAER